MSAATLDPAGQWYSIYEALREMPRDAVQAHPILKHIWLGVMIDGEVRNGGWPQAYWNLRGRSSLAQMAATCSALGGEAEAEQALKIDAFLNTHPRVKEALDEGGPFGLPGSLRRLADRLNSAFYVAEPTLRVRLQEYIWAHRADPQLAAVIARAQPYEAYKNQSPLHCAADDGNLALVQRELARGVDPNIEDDEKGTALMEALGRQKGPLRDAILDALIEAGADVNRLDWLGRLPTAIADTDRGIVMRLREAGLDLTRTDKHGSTVIFDARDATTVRLLIKAGLDANRVNDHGITPLHLAALRLARASTQGEIKKALSVCRALIEAGALNTVTPRGQDAFWFAADFDYAIRGLHQLGLTVVVEADAEGRHGRTALHRAAANGETAPIALLVEAGAPINARARESDAEVPAGATPLTVARIKKNTRVANMLIKRGAEA